MNETFKDIKDYSKDPNLNYIEKPKITTKKDLELQRKKENFEEFKKCESKQDTF